jgi:hypothetical protein
MTPGDVARLLAACAMYDFRPVETADAAAWFQVVGDLDYDDAMESVRRHYQVSTDRMMPAHVRQGVKAIRADRSRLQKHEVRELPSRFEDDMGRQVRIASGAATAREVLAPLLEHLAQKSGEPAGLSALDQLRELTTGPNWDVDEESTR